MTTHTDVERFLQELFPDHAQHAIFTNLNPAADTRNVTELDDGRDCYLGPWAYPDDGKLERGARATEARCLVIDDVGTAVDPFTGEAISKVSFEQVARLGPYTAVTRTSPGNHQYWFKLDPPVPTSEWPGFKAGIIKILGVTPDNLGVGQIFRMPMGRNTKRGYNVELIALKEGVVLKSATIPREAVKGPKTPGEARKSRAVHDIKQLVEWVSNDDLSYDEWIAKGQRIYALDPGEDGREAWHELSGRSDKNNTEITETKWHTFTADITRGGLLLAEAQAAGGEAFTRWEAKEVFNDGVIEAEPPPKLELAKRITATPFKLRDAASLPLREWLYGRILLRKFLTMTVAPGGLGKSSLIAAETLAQVTGCELLWERAKQPLRVWLWNLEDPLEETERKIVAAALRHGVTDIGDRLFVDSGRAQKLVIATTDRSKPVIVQPVVDELVAEIRRRGVDVVVIDPFVSCHELPENDNTAQDMIVKEWGRVAELGNCAVHLVDHTRKAPQGAEVWTESARGAKAKTDAARVVRVLNQMTDTEAISFGVSSPRQYFYTSLDKANMSLPPPMDYRDWFHMESVNLGNGGLAEGIGAARLAGDDIGVTVRWTPPSAENLRTTENFEKVAEAMGNKRWRIDSRADEWVGKAFGTALEFDPKTKKVEIELRHYLKDG